MPRKPNYQFERHERDRAKAQKKAARLAAKAERRAAQNPEGSQDAENPQSTEDRGTDDAGGDTADGPSVTTTSDQG